MSTFTIEADQYGAAGNGTTLTARVASNDITNCAIPYKGVATGTLNGRWDLYATGAPSSSDGAPIGSTYTDSAGGASTTLYVKTGASTWTAK